MYVELTTSFLLPWDLSLSLSPVPSDPAMFSTTHGVMGGIARLTGLIDGGTSSWRGPSVDWRTAFISDPHGDPVALRSVIRDLEEQGSVDEVLVGGVWRSAGRSRPRSSTGSRSWAGRPYAAMRMIS